ncbi:MAG: hypothetical protein ABI467_16240 [Kofleriaceae bacterium]
MVRAALWAVVACAVVPSCGTKERAPAAQPGEVAGKVLEVSGSVKVGARQLAVGDTVKSDDTIETGADGNVVIELAHNHARWTLGPGHQLRPTESLAWAQARHGSASAVEQDTSAAGRPAERSAADTGTSAKSVAPPTPPARGAAPELEPEVHAFVGAPAAAAPPPPAPPPPPPAKTAAHGTAREDEAVRGSVGGAAGAPGQGGGGALTEDMFAKLTACVPAGSHVHVKIHVANHVPAITFDDGTEPAVERCLTAAAAKLSLAVATGELSLTLHR